MLSGGRNSEFDPVRCALDAAAYQNWLEHPQNDNPDHVRVLKALKMALDQELSDCQRRYVTAYYVEGLTVTQVAERYHITRATVSRTLTRARRRLWRVVRYSSIRLLHTSDGGE